MRIPNSVRCLLVGLMMAAMCATASAGIFISVNFGPPPLPVYVQPVCPAPGYIFTPGYWAYGPDGYFWVPGTWVVAPQPGLLWTPGYWGFAGGVYGWHPGYWGPTIGFYGGINYGFGYTGVGYAGGYWRGGQFFYNRNVNNVNVVNVHNVYNTTVINNTTVVNRVAYNGGPGGIVARPTPAEEVAARQQHFEATAVQVQHETMAKSNRDLLASVNHGKPAIAATSKPAQFEHAVAAKSAGAPYRAPEAGAARANASVPRPGAETPRADAASRGAVPRPPSSYRETSTARNENTAHANAASRPEVARPSNVTRPASSPRGEQASRESSPSNHQAAPAPRASAPRPQSQPHSEAAPRSESHGERPER